MTGGEATPDASLSDVSYTFAPSDSEGSDGLIGEDVDASAGPADTQSTDGGDDVGDTGAVAPDVGEDATDSEDLLMHAPQIVVESPAVMMDAVAWRWVPIGEACNEDLGARSGLRP